MLLLMSCLTALLVESHGDLLQLTNATTYNFCQNSIYLYIYIYNNHLDILRIAYAISWRVAAVHDTMDSDSCVIVLGH